MNTQLKNWSFGVSGDAYTPPEMMEPRLSGKVYNHPNPTRHYDGKEIVTSRIVGKRKGLVVTQSGSEYELLDVDPEYEKLYPNAKERLINQLKEI
jgi:hypothetical protein